MKTKNFDFSYFITVLLVYIVSNSFFIIFSSSSLRDSMIVGIIMLIFIVSIVNITLTKLNRSFLNIVIISTFFLIFHTLFATIIFGVYDIWRSVLSILLTFFLLITSSYFVNYSKKIHKDSFNKTIFFVYVLILFNGFLAYFFQRFNVISGKGMIIFKEPSHFALIFLPFLLFVGKFGSLTRRNFHIIISVGLALLLENVTMLVGVFGIFLLINWKNKKNIILGSIILTITIQIVGLAQLDYYTSRIFINSESSNLSVLVWLSGWERAYMAWKESSGWGIGFQQMGYVGENGIYMDYIFSKMGRWLNLYDGGSLAPKLIAELGVLGIVILLFYLKGIKTAISVYVDEEASEKNVLFASIYIMFLFQLFVRGVGYFSPSFLMFISSVYWIINYNSDKNDKLKVYNI